MKIAVTGSSGLIGTAFADAARRDGDELIRLVRRPPRGPGEVSWDPAAARGGIGPTALAGGDAGLNPAGAPGRAPRQPDHGHRGTGLGADCYGQAAGRAAVRVGHRLVLRYRRARS